MPVKKSENVGVYRHGVSYNPHYFEKKSEYDIIKRVLIGVVFKKQIDSE